MLKVVTIAFIALAMTGCSTFQRRSPNQDEMKVVLKDKDGNIKNASGQATGVGGKEITPINPDEPQFEAQSQAAEVKEAVAAAAEHIHATHGQEQPRTIGQVPAAKALGWLKNGNTRFVKGFFRKDGTTAKDRKRLAAVEAPHAVIVSSSDSRVPPEIVFDQKLGEIFVVRNAVAATDLGLISSVEYAVLDLGSNLVVVLGNSAKDSWMNVDKLSKDLQDKSDILRNAVASGDVKIVTAMYDLESGRITWR